MKIPLFDNDGTLLQAASNTLHEAAFAFAFKKIFDIEASTHDISFHGMIDNQIIVEVMKLHGVPKADTIPKLPEAIQTMVTYFKEHESECNIKPNAGASELLQTLQNHSTHSGVLTGNVEEIGWMKLKAAGLKEYIDFGSFGNLAMKRVDLIEIAQQRYNEKFSENRSITDFVIIGDTPKDIACAREGGIQVIAVASGNYTLKQLEQEKPDLLVESLEEKEKILEFLSQ